MYLITRRTYGILYYIVWFSCCGRGAAAPILLRDTSVKTTHATIEVLLYLFVLAETVSD